MVYANLKAAVGIYVTAKAVTVAQVKWTLQGPRLIKLIQIEMKSEQPGKKELIEAIREAFKQSGIENKGVVSGVIGKEVMIRFFRMPRIPKEELNNALKFEAKRYIPFRIEEVVWGFQTIEKKSEPKLEVIFAASKKDHINEHLSLLREGGLTPLSIEPACFSILRTLYFTGQIKKTETVAVVNVDSSATEITIVRDDIPYLSRTLNLTVNDSQTLLDSLFNEIQLSFNYYRRQFPGDSINRVILYAGEKELGEANESLSKELKIPVVKAAPVEAPGGRQYCLAEFSIAYGLALRKVVKPKLEIELYREEKNVPETKKKLIKMIVVSLFLTILILGGLYLFMSQRVGKLNNELNRTKQVRINTDLVPVDASDSEIEKIKAETGVRVKLLKKIIGRRIYWTTKFNEIPKLLPEGVWFEDIRLEERISNRAKRIQRSFTLTGNVFLGDASEEMELLNDFLSDLKKSEAFFEGFQEIKLNRVAREKNGNYELTKFEISCSGEK